MKKIKYFIILILIFTLISFSFAQQKKEELKITIPPELKLPYAATVQQISGKITSIQEQSIKVSKNFKNEVIEVSLSVNPSTKIQKDKTDLKFNSLKIGDTVIVRYNKVNNVFIAKNIDVQ